MTLVWTAVTLMVLIGFVGLSIDWGKLALNVHQMQNAADAAALAGAEKIPEGLSIVIARAQEVAANNYAEQKVVTLRSTEQPEGFDGADESPYDVIVGRYLPQFRGTLNEWQPRIINANAVKVFARREDAGSATAPPLAMLFGPIFGVRTVEAHRSAVAMLLYRNGAGLICLAATGYGIAISNNTSLIIQNGEVQVNSGGDPSIQVGDRATLEALGLTTCGYVDNATRYSFPVLEEAPWMDDPLALVPDLPTPDLGVAMKWNPATSTWVDAGVAEATEIIDTSVIKKAGGYDPDDAGMPMLKLTPGYYPKGINLSTGAKLVLSPGVYAVGGNKGTKSGLVATGGTLIAEGVMVYVTQDGNGNWGEINLNGGTASIRISEYTYDSASDPLAWKVYGDAGLAIFQDRNRPPYAVNESSAQPFFSGSNQSSFAGTVYLHNYSETTVPYISGGAGSIGIQIITDRIQLGGGGQVVIDYDGRNRKADVRPFLVR
jgi:hypothetical protein